MPKVATKWKTNSGYDTATQIAEGSSLLLETGFHLLLETGDRLLLESTKITPKESTAWRTPVKQSTAWQQRDGSSSVVVGIKTRITQNNAIRITQDGKIRITQPATFTAKPATKWREV